MNNTLSISLAAVLTLASATAQAQQSPARTGGLAVPANRIVGLWSNVAQVGPCGGAAGATIRQTLLFEPGGGFIDNAPFPPQGAPNVYGVAGLNQRSIGLGTWSYEPLTGRYTLDQRFDWFVDNTYHGYQIVHRTILLSNDGRTASGPVHTIRYAANGSVVVELCGSAVSNRL